MKTVKTIIVAVLLAGSMAVQAEARNQGVNGLMVGAGGAPGGYASAQPAVFLPPPPPPPNLVFSFGGRPDHRYYGPIERCRDIVTVKCWYGRCREVVRTECRDRDRWRDRDWRGDHHWRGDRRWHDDRRDRWRDDNWRDRHRDRW